MKNIKKGKVCAKVGFELHKESEGQLPKQTQPYKELVNANTRMIRRIVRCFILLSKIGLKKIFISNSLLRLHLLKYCFF